MGSADRLPPGPPAPETGPEPTEAPVEGPDSVAPPSFWRGYRRAIAVVAVAVLAVVFARTTRSAVRYDTDPDGRPALDQSVADAVAGDSAGTGCGGWTPLLSVSETPDVEPLNTAVWADTEAFHAESVHLYVRALRFDVEDGTAVTDGAAAASSLTVPVRSGQTVDVTIACSATAVTIHLLGADGKDVDGATVSVGAQPGQPGPLRLAKGAAGPTPEACRELLDAQESFGTAVGGQASVDATRRLLDVARSSLAAVRDDLTGEERADADVLILLLQERLGELKQGKGDALRPVSADAEAALAGVVRTFQRLCG